MHISLQNFQMKISNFNTPFRKQYYFIEEVSEVCKPKNIELSDQIIKLLIFEATSATGIY